MSDQNSPSPPPPSRTTTDMFGDPIGSHPQWFKQSSFLDADFDSESYIADLRTFVPFDTLRSELRSHLSALKHELVELINRDYADFVNLSTKLVDVDSAVVRMRAPLTEIREKIVGFREALEGSLVALQSGLAKRAEAAAAREVLELLLDTFHVVSKVEKLIQELPSVPADWSNGDINFKEKGHLSNGISLHHAENGTAVRETQSMLLERIASEMNRLKFYFAHAQNLPFIQNMEKRIQSASSLLDASLGHCFVDGLEHRDESAVYNCLRAFAAIDNAKSAEDIFRSTVVAPLILKVIPHSSSGVVGGQSGDELEEDYKEIKRYIEKDCKFLLEIASTENSGLHVFSFLANSVLKEVLSAIQKGKPGAFSPGRPTEFLINYKSSVDFLAQLEGYCPSRAAVAKFRTEAVYIEFMKQWNIGVYFSLRYSNWLSAGLAARKANKSGSIPGSEWAVAAIPDDLVHTIKNTNAVKCRESPSAGQLIHDLNCLAAEICGGYLEHVLERLRSCSTEVLDIVKHSILQSGKALKDIIPQLITSIIETLVGQSVEDLRQLKGITATYRMTNKPQPVRYSPYVSGVLRPLKLFLDGEHAAAYLTMETKNELLKGAAFEITDRYKELAVSLVDVARKTETSLQKIRKGAQRRGGANLDNSEYISDTDKEYGRNLSALGVEAAKIPSYCTLWQCVAPADEQNTIKF
ncbi:hypothetical protein RJ639_026953 [Escallonia herrerae]|uniref:Conserved oligomeric Golgi complex subunit 2 n=1 Tax=Escallonia herrerae TaxID=1293975 RepID=A0AA88X643_9ASTE|nr:hypothetical protein RJ639_026953 [Escallonia herrerae]